MPTCRTGFANKDELRLPVSTQTHLKYAAWSAWLQKRIAVQVLGPTALAIDPCNAKRNYIRYPRVIFEWDERKRELNIAKHAIDFADCQKVFAGSTVTVRDDRFTYGEERFVTFGLLDGRVVAVAHAETTEIIRVVSMRKATRYEQALFFEALQN